MRERRNIKIKIILAAVLMCGIFYTNAFACSQEDLARVIANPKTSPYYSFDNSELKKIILDIADRAIDRQEELDGEMSKAITYDPNNKDANIKLQQDAARIDSFLEEIFNQQSGMPKAWKYYHTSFSALQGIISVKAMALAAEKKYEKELLNVPENMRVYHMKTAQSINMEDFADKVLADKDKDKVVRVIATLEFYLCELLKLDKHNLNGKDYLKNIHETIREIAKQNNLFEEWASSR